MIKRALSMGMVLALLAGCGAAGVQTVRASDGESRIMVLESAGNIPLSEYENLEVLVQYGDGNIEVMSFDYQKLDIILETATNEYRNYLTEN